MIDIDGVLFAEVDYRSLEPLALLETARDVGQSGKPSRALEALARRADLPGIVVLYRLSSDPNPSDPRFSDIVAFRVRVVYPTRQSGWRTLTPPQWAQELMQIREWSSRRAGLVATNDPRWAQCCE